MKPVALFLLMCSVAGAVIAATGLSVGVNNTDGDTIATQEWVNDLPLAETNAYNVFTSSNKFNGVDIDGLANVTSNANEGTHIVNFVTMTNWVTEYTKPSFVEGWTDTGSITLTNQGVYYPWTTWTPGEWCQECFAFTNYGVEVLSGGEGIYQLIGSLSVACNSQTEDIHAHVATGTVANGVVQCAKLHKATYFNSINKEYSMAITGLLRVEAGMYLEVQFECTSGSGRVLSAGDLNFQMHKVSD